MRHGGDIVHAGDNLCAAADFAILYRLPAGLHAGAGVRHLRDSLLSARAGVWIVRLLNVRLLNLRRTGRMCDMRLCPARLCDMRRRLCDVRRRLCDVRRRLCFGRLRCCIGANGGAHVSGADECSDVELHDAAFVDALRSERGDDRCLDLSRPHVCSCEPFVSCHDDLFDAGCWRASLYACVQRTGIRRACAVDFDGFDESNVCDAGIARQSTDSWQPTDSWQHCAGVADAHPRTRARTESSGCRSVVVRINAGRRFAPSGHAKRLRKNVQAKFADHTACETDPG
jgi:hypothetical protein